jgi:hypothetical protein
MGAARSASVTLGLARAAFVATFGALIVVFAYGVVPIWSEASTVGARPEYSFATGHYHLSPAEADALENIGLSPAWHAGVVLGRYAVLFATASVIAALLWLRSRSWPALYVAWFLIASPFLFWSEAASEHAPRLVELGANVVTAVGFLSVFALLLVFPGDRFAPWVLATAAGVLAILTYLYLANIETDWIWSAGVVLALGTLLTGLVLQIVTAIRTDRDRWLRLALTAGGVTLFVLLMATLDSLSGISQPGTGLDTLARRLGVETTVMVLPVLFGVGVVYLVMRRGLWDLDLSLNRAFVYSALTALLVAVYFLVVILVQAMVNDVAGIERSTLAVVISTGLIAVLALPAREWVQRFIDRVFFRRRYDLERTVESFEARLQDRDRLELVGSDLLDSASDAFQPEHASLWVPEVRQ